MEIKLNLNEPKIKQKVMSDKFGLLVSNEWKRLLDPYTPKNTGTLMRNTELLPHEIWYKEPYASAVYYNPRGVTYITQGTGRNLFATEKWDIAAEQAGQKDKLYRILNNALKSGTI